MNLVYLAALLVSLAGMLILDARFRLFLWRAPRPAFATLAVGVLLLLAVDLVAIALGIFHVGASPVLSGVMLAPHLPLEEPVFLLFLCQLTMVVHELAARMAPTRRRSRDGGR